MRAFQQRRLQALIAHAYAQCRYYRNQFDARGIRPAEIRDIDDLERVPVLHREAVAAHFEPLTAGDAESYSPARAFTSGTSGTQLEFLRDRATVSLAQATSWRFFQWHGVRHRDRSADIRVFRPRSDSSTGVVYSRGSRKLGLNIHGIDPSMPRMIAEELKRFQPDVVYTGSPAWLTFLSLYLLDHPEYRVRPRTVFTCGERLFPEQRSIIGQAFGAPVIDFYANREHSLFGGECERGRLHLFVEMGIVEVLKSGRPCPPGDEGLMVVTNLWNRSMPFIRYAIGDIGRIEPEACPCGRSLPTAKILGGRTRDLLATRNGYFLVPTFLLATPRWMRKIAAIKFYQETKDDVTAFVVKGPAFSDADGPALRADLEETFGGLLRVSMEFCESLEQTPGGKYRYVLSKVSVEV